MQKSNFMQSFKTSSYITAGWNWFMMLAGRSAEAVLTISVLYSCARLLPGVNLPVQVDNSVFIAQMVALDVGGLSLGKMAKAAKREGNLEGALLARRVSIALISIMIANVVLSVLQTIIPGMPGQLVAVVEAILLIARAIMAVLYAHVIHSLKRDHGQEGESGRAAGGLDDWQMVGLTAYLMQTTQQVVAGAISEASANFNQILTSITEDQANIQATLQHIQTTPATLPTVDNQTIIAGVVAQFETRFTSAMKRLESEVKQNVLVSLATEPGQMKQPGGTNGTALNGPRLVSLPQRSVPPGRVKQPTTDEHKAVQAETDSADCKSAVYARLDQDNTLQPADLARMTGFPRTTVWRHWNRYHEENGTRGLAQIAAGNVESQQESETA